MNVDRDELVSLTAALVGKPSENPPGDERRVVDALLERLDRSPIEFDVETHEALPDRENVVARAGNSDRGSVLLTGHTDVVPAAADDWSGDPYELREEDGHLVGRGAADMKGALATKIVAAESYLASTDDPGEVILAFVVDEEWDGKGTQTLVERGLTADYAIIGEPTRLQTCVAQKGVARYELAVRGVSAHSGTPQEGEDAVLAAGRLLTAFESMNEELETETSHALLAPETITVTEITGGTAPNVVADRATLTVDWRFLPGHDRSPERFDERVSRLIRETDLGADVEVSVERLVFARAGEIDPGHELVETAVESAADVGVESAPVGFNAATDARFLLHDAEIPTVLFGPGSIADDAHTVDESVAVSELEATAKTYRRALDRLL
ncbi:hypothetical protein CV102_23830 [Natronococcus pandeyae]|uniref:Probable succinyl-diaminopimelate desuccinylase n=1 Tax=Natronococcus pandeyae TaxID=2055836 RepID=A0A8J8TPT1_9EURY|nr:M20 family metallopeptidase [Natronococcus pandeyae]TYL36175.1 hypothetical protein CV102_23830 [Natronococcus pandeyae]